MPYIRHRPYTLRDTTNAVQGRPDHIPYATYITRRYSSTLHSSVRPQLTFGNSEQSIPLHTHLLPMVHSRFCASQRIRGSAYRSIDCQHIWYHGALPISQRIRVQDQQYRDTLTIEHGKYSTWSTLTNGRIHGDCSNEQVSCSTIMVGICT